MFAHGIGWALTGREDEMRQLIAKWMSAAKRKWAVRNPAHCHGRWDSPSERWVEEKIERVRHRNTNDETHRGMDEPEAEMRFLKTLEIFENVRKILGNARFCTRIPWNCLKYLILYWKCFAIKMNVNTALRFSLGLIQMSMNLIILDRWDSSKSVLSRLISISDETHRPWRWVTAIPIPCSSSW